MRTIDRRTFVRAGLALAGSCPFLCIESAAAAASVFTKKSGYTRDGSSLNGLVKVGDKTYLYQGGQKFTDGVIDFNGERYFHTDGTMAVKEVVDGIYYGSDGIKGSGWVEDDKGKMYFADDGQYFGWLELDDGRCYLDTETGYLKTGWFEDDGDMYCADKTTGVVLSNTTKVDPYPEEDTWASIYDFDENGKASWHLPVPDDVEHYQGAPIPEQIGDARQRMIRNAFSRIGTPYAQNAKNTERPECLVCDGLTSWSFWATFGFTIYSGADSIHSDIGTQYDWCNEHGGIKTREEMRAGDMVFEDYGDYLNHRGDYSHGYHALLYVGNNMTVDATGGLGVSWRSFDETFGLFTCGGSPYSEDQETSRVPVTA